MKFAPLSLVLVFVLFLSACAPKAPVASASTLPPANPPLPVASTPPAANPPEGSAASPDLVRTDEQGMVVVEVIPLNLTKPGSTLDFQLSLNPHSVNLNMDFTKLATLSTDNGNSVQATTWEGPNGGHHVMGTIQFPSTENGKSMLDGATKVTFTLKDVDAPERVFSWDLGK